MRKTGKYAFLLWMFLMIVTLFGQKEAVFAGTAENDETLKVGNIGYAGFIEEGEPGSFKGYGVAYLNRISQYTGWKYEYVSENWENALKKLENGELDLICTAQKTNQREERFLYSAMAIGTEETVIYSASENQDIFYRDYAHMNEATVAMLEDSFQNNEFVKYAELHNINYSTKMYASNYEMENAVKSGEVDLAVMGSLSIHSELKVVDKFSPEPFYIITGKENGRIVEELNEAQQYLKASSPDFETQLYRQYYLNGTLDSGPLLTREEAEYVKSAQPLTVACIDGFFPMSYKDAETGVPAGVLTDITRKIGEISGIKMNMISIPLGKSPAEFMEEGGVDLVSGAFFSQELMENPHIHLSDPILSQSVFLIGKPAVNVYDAEEAVIVLPLQYKYSPSLVPEELKSCKTEYRDTEAECFEAVEAGEADFTIQGIYAMNYFMQMKKFAKMQAAALNKVKEEGCLLAPDGDNRMLMSVLNKTINCLDEDTKNQIIGDHTIGRDNKNIFTDFVYEYRWQILVAAGMTALIVTLVINLNKRKLKMQYEQREKENYKRSAESDELTGLLNRKAFYSYASQRLEKNPEKEYWILFLNIENFKVFNDLFGMESADELLQFIAGRLKNWTDTHNELCARFEADHFWVFSERRKEELLGLVNEITHRANEEHADIVIDFCCGMYLIKNRNNDINIMCDRAHMAADSVKGNHMQHVAVYNDTHREKMLKEQSIVSEMEAALEAGQFKVFLQPKYNIFTGKIVGAEALVRWAHPEKGIISPAEFIPIFEKNGFIGRLDSYMLEAVCMLLQKWGQEGRKLFPVSVNLSRVEFYSPMLCKNICSIAEQYHISPRLLELEVTESAYVTDTRVVISTLHTMRTKGFRILMDDFGSGYSSLNMLKEAPIDQMKLDMRFLNATDPYDRAEKILRTVIAMGNEMSVSVLAEGVETEEQVEMLKDYSCALAQGYYYSRPLPVEEYEKLIV